MFLQDDRSIWTRHINLDGMKLSREKVTTTNGNGVVTINKIDKERLVTLLGVKYSTNHWFNDILVDFWMVW